MRKKLVTTAYGLYGLEIDTPVALVVAENMKGGRNEMAEYIYHADPIGEGEYSHTLVGELVRCGECMHNGSFDTDCPIDWSGKEYCNFGERRADDE